MATIIEMRPTGRRETRSVNDGPLDPRPLDVILREEIRQRGASEFDGLSAQDQKQLAKEFYCTPDVIRTVLDAADGRRARARAAESHARARAEVAEIRARGARSGRKQRADKFPKGANVTMNMRDGSSRAAPPPRGQDPLWTDEALRDSPNMLAAIDAVSEFLGIGVHGSPALRFQMIEKTLKRWEKRGDKQAELEGEATLALVRRCRRTLRDAMAQDGQRHIQLAEAHRLVRWQAEAAASRGL